MVGRELEFATDTSNDNRDWLIGQGLRDDVLDMWKVILVVVGHFSAVGPPGFGLKYRDADGASYRLALDEGYMAILLRDERKTPPRLTLNLRF